MTEELALPLPEVEFQALIRRITTLKPDAVFAFFAGGGAVEFAKGYAAAGLLRSVPLYGAGFLTDGTLQAQGADANGVRMTLHYADNLNCPANWAFLETFKAKTVQDGDIFAVQGFDAAALFHEGLKATKGNWSARAQASAQRLYEFHEFALSQCGIETISIEIISVDRALNHHPERS